MSEMNKFNLTEVKKLLHETIGQDFLKEGFSFNKSSFEFRKVVAGSKVLCTFFFYNYAPISIEYNFNFYSSIKEIEAERKTFLSFLGQPYRWQETIGFREGDFHPATKHANMKTRIALTHMLRDDTLDHQVISGSREVLKNEFFSRLPILLELKAFQDFIFSDLNNIVKCQLTLPSLLAAKLKGKDEFREVLSFLKHKLDYDNLEPNDATRKELDNMSDFEKHAE